MKGFVAVELVTRIEALMRKADDGKGISMAELARRSQLGTNTVRKIIKTGTEPKYPTLVKLAEGLGVPVEDLSSDRPEMAVYTLADCPVAVDFTYQLNLHSSMMPGLFAEPCECGVEVAPWDEDAKEQAGWAIFRRNGETNAITAKVYSEGDNLLLFSAMLLAGSNQSPNAQLIDGENGEILGAIFGVLWSDAFRR